MIGLLFFGVFVSFVAANDNQTPIVTTSIGKIQGKIVDYENRSVYHFLGVPYAKPPINSLRYQLPVSPDPLNDTKKVTDYGPACMQSSGREKFGKMSEDCLYLNLYVTESTFNRKSGHLRPVLFWIHGGGLMNGAGNDLTQGIPMVPLHDVVLVTINYRLNAFGFLHLGDHEPRIPSNLGFRDQLLALQWVHDNIDLFGGDPNKVTIFGESAGSMSVSAHLISPLSKGLFHRGILESGTILRAHKNESIGDNSLTLINETSCASKADILACLQSLDASEIIKLLKSTTNPRFGHIFGDEFLPFTPTEAFSQSLFDNSVDILVGVEQNEAALFLLSLNSTEFDLISPAPLSYEKALNYMKRITNDQSFDFFREIYFNTVSNDSAYVRSQLEKAFSDVWLICPTYMYGLEYARSSGTVGGKVYAYLHAQQPTMYPPCNLSTWMGVCHAAEIPHVFGVPFISPGYSEKDFALSLEMMKIWTHFAETGETPSIGSVQWKPLQEDESAMIMNIDQWGKVDRERIANCKKIWPYVVGTTN